MRISVHIVAREISEIPGCPEKKIETYIFSPL
jgi:hypothetical protein